MTKADKPIWRETYSTVRQRGTSRPLVIEVNPTYVRIKLKGMRSWYTVSHDQIWTLGAKNAVEAARREWADKKKARSDDH